MEHDIPGLVLDHCIDAVLIQGVSVETCLRMYPSYEAELRSLVEEVESLKTLARTLVPSEGKDRGWAYLRAKAGQRLD